MLIICTMLIFPAESVRAQDEVSQLLSEVNAVRASLGLHGYVLNSSLMAAAQAHSEWMAATAIVAHDEDNGSSPQSRASAFGYPGSRVSENIYSGYHVSAMDALTWWLSSPIHYAGITHAEKNEIGIGIAQSGDLRYFTLVFGRGSGGSAPPVQPQSPPPDSAAESPSVEIAAAPPIIIPTQPPPTRPLITWTPSATIPSQTPTITWTPTFTWTPSPTDTLIPPTGTAIVLAAAKPLPSITPTSTQMLVALAPLHTSIRDEAPAEIRVNPEDSGFELNLRMLLPVLIFVQVIGIVWVLRRLWRP